VLGGDAGERVPDHPGQVRLDLRVIAGDGCEELSPCRAIALRYGGGDFGHVIGAIVWLEFPAAQVHGAPGGVKRPKILVPLVARSGMPSVSACEPLDGCDRACAGDLGRDLGLLAVCGGLTADETCEVESFQRGLMLPMSAGPAKPSPPRCDVAPVLGVAAVGIPAPCRARNATSSSCRWLPTVLMRAAWPTARQRSVSTSR
jgi:hypothetical protein